MYEEVNIINISYFVRIGAALGPLLAGWISDDFVRFLVPNYTNFFIHSFIHYSVINQAYHKFNDLLFYTMILYIDHTVCGHISIHLGIIFFRAGIVYFTY